MKFELHCGMLRLVAFRAELREAPGYDKRFEALTNLIVTLMANAYAHSEVEEAVHIEIVKEKCDEIADEAWLKRKDDEKNGGES